MNALIFLVPVAFGLISLLRTKSDFAFWIFTGYFYGFVVLTMVSDPGFAVPYTLMDFDTVTGIRAALHLVLLFAGLAWLSQNRDTIRPTADNTLLFLSLLLVLGQSLSQIQNGVFFSAGNGARSVLNLVYFFNFFVVIFTALTRADNDRLAKFADVYISVIFGLCLVMLFVLLVWGPYPEGNLRLGRPLNPTVFSALVFIAFTLSFFIRRNAIVSWFFLAMIIFSGSRTALGSVFFCVALRYRTNAWIIVLPVGAFLLSLFFIDYQALIVELFKSQFYARSDWSSGRVLGWVTALSLVPSHWMWGVGERYELKTLDPMSPTVRLHDGPFEAILSFGLIYTVAMISYYAYLIWKAGFSKRTARYLTRSERNCFLGILCYTLIEFLFGTMYWTNLGDPYSVAAIVFILLFITRENRRAALAHAPRANNRAAAAEFTPQGDRPLPA